MDTLITTRQRDAYQVIKGFVYQVDLTIERWININDGQLLELEAGEDIDIVGRYFTVEGKQRTERILQQIKERQKNLTLKSPSALGSLASFYEHIGNNPDKALKFHYVTNAKISAERPSPIKDKTPLIKVWEDIRTGKTKKDENSELLKKIKEVLQSAKKPDKKFSKETWNSFQNFIKSSTLEELQEFIKKVRWLTLQIEPEELSHLIRTRLSKKFELTMSKAERVYQKLFHFVFKKLTYSGVKRLEPTDLASLISDDPLTSEDKKEIELIFNRISNIEKVIENHEKRISSLEQVAPKIPNIEEIKIDKKVTTSSIKEIIDEKRNC